ncbi:Transcriptional Coactivator p15 (Hypothetical proteinypothetical protein) [Nesidiocoris tenuis]|uniref:Transcriptional coactivator p15 (PC4) C-terminal domain-containing protein n=1 Tax=Nesidiocoris tenuis TaxID=355587 RepID=A0ABN7AYH1_9HEMI|nr:Transcriptional Coactivator p15 (Hypothetical proteinypothetical protein) [Nesidiocoris tenuis]
MPRKKRKDESSSDTSVHDSSDEKPAKKAKTEKGGKSSNSDPDSIESWDIGGKRVAKVRKFKNRLFVDIREYYMDNNGDMKPGKKGISLSVDQWKKLKDIVSEIDKTVDENN